MLKTFYSVIAALTGSDAQASVASAKCSTSFLRDPDMPEKGPRSPSKGLEEFRGIRGTITLAEALKAVSKGF